MVVGLPAPLPGLFPRPLLPPAAVLAAVALPDLAFVGQLVDFADGHFDRVEVPEAHPNDKLDKFVAAGKKIII